MKVPVAVTGASGFVGSHLVERLNEMGIVPRVLVRNPEKVSGWKVEPIKGDLSASSMDAMRKLASGAKVLFHLAGTLRSIKKDEFYATNTVGTSLLASAFREVADPEGIFVYVSSLAAAGPSNSQDGVSPEDPPHPVSQYGESKLGGEKAVISQLGTGMRWSILRPPVVYGPKDRDVFQFFKMAKMGLALIPKRAGMVSVIFVSDLITAMLSAAERDTCWGKILHVAEPKSYGVREMMEIVAKTGGYKVRIVPVPRYLVKLAGSFGAGLHMLGFKQVAMTPDKAREMLAGDWVSNTEGSHKLLGMHRFVSFEEGCMIAWEWYRRAGWL